MTNYCILLLTVASITLSVAVSDEVSLRRRLLHDPRTVVRKPDYARMQNSDAGSQLSSGHFATQVLQAEAESASLAQGNQPLQQGVVPRQKSLQGQQQLRQGDDAQQLQGMTDSSSIQHTHVGSSSLMQQESQDLQQMGDTNAMRQQPQNPQQMGGLSMMQEQPQDLQQIEGESVMRQQPVDDQQMNGLSMMQQQPQDLEQMEGVSMLQQESQDPHQQGGLSSMQQQPQDPQQMGGLSMMQQAPLDPQQMGGLSIMQQEPKDPQQTGGVSMMQQQRQDPQQMTSSSLMSLQQVPEMSGQQLQRGGTDHTGSQQEGEVLANPTASSGLQGGQGNEQQQSGTENVLEFIHITKSGGSAIEAAAAKHNIMWSACHYWKITYLGCTSPDWEFPKSKRVERMPAGLVYQGEPWHSPPHWNEPNMMEGRDTFVVVRNPYERIVSEYYCSAFGYKGDDRENPDVFNHWLAGNLTLLGEKLQGHMLPQHYYVYDEKGDKVVTHILRYENLQPEFDALMDRYNLPIRMPVKNAKTVFHYKGKKGNTNGERITVNSISPENIQKINEVYARDFEFFFYPLIRVTPSMSEGMGGILSPMESDAQNGMIEGINGHEQLMNPQGLGTTQMRSQETRGSLLSNGNTHQVMDQDSRLGVSNQGQSQSRIGEFDNDMSATGRDQPLPMLGQQQVMGQDGRSLMNGKQQQIFNTVSGGAVGIVGQQQIGEGGLLNSDRVVQEPSMVEGSSGIMSSRSRESSSLLAAAGGEQLQALQGQTRQDGNLSRSNLGEQSLGQIESRGSTSSSLGGSSISGSGSLQTAERSSAASSNRLASSSTTSGAKRGSVSQAGSLRKGK